MKFSGAQPELMSIKINSIVRSFIIVPIVASTLSMNAFTASVNKVMLPEEQTVLQAEELALQKEREENAAKINAYFAQYDLPLAGYGMKIVIEGEKYGIDPFLIASIAMRESTGCKFIPKNSNNCFGWGKAKFESINNAIETIAMNLGGHNPNTARYYKGKSLEGILKSYNSVIPSYTQEIVSIMKRIDQMPV